MTVKELKEAIANLPDDMEIVVEIDAELHPLHGATSDEISTEILNNQVYIDAKYEW